MGFEEKLNAVLNEIKEVYGLTDAHISIIRLNVMKRVSLYNDVKYVKDNDECSFLVNDNTIGDMLINRLINNIKNYEFSQIYDLKDKTKGCYKAKMQTFTMANYNSVRDLTRERLSNIPNVDEKMVYNSTIKVMNHELGHVFQTSFNGNIGNFSQKFKTLISNLMKKYPNEFVCKDFSNMNVIKRGMTVDIKNDDKKEIRSYYAQIHDMSTNLDEIFNEEESIEVTGINNPQFTYKFNDEFEKNIYNYESSNYKITSYATLMKILLGKQKKFESMYLDSVVCYEFFDEYQEIAKEVFVGSKYMNKPPMVNVLNALDEIKNGNITETLKLDLFFTKILFEKAKDILNDSNLTIEQLEEFEKDVSTFKANLTHSNKRMLEQDVIVSKIEEAIITKKNNLGNNKSNLSNDKVSYVVQQMNQAKVDNDEVAYNYWQSNLDSLIEKKELEDNSGGVAIDGDYIPGR